MIEICPLAREVTRIEFIMIFEGLDFTRCDIDPKCYPSLGKICFAVGLSSRYPDHRCDRGEVKYYHSDISQTPLAKRSEILTGDEFFLYQNRIRLIAQCIISVENSDKFSLEVSV